MICDHRLFVDDYAHDACRLLGLPVPPWVALAGREVPLLVVIEAYQLIWHLPAPKVIIDSVRATTAAHDPDVNQ